MILLYFTIKLINFIDRQIIYYRNITTLIKNKVHENEKGTILIRFD